MFYSTLSSGKIFSAPTPVLFIICSFAYCLRGLWKLAKNNHWSNKKLLTFDDLSLTKEWYTVEDMTEEREVIIHITSDELKHIHEDTKKELFQRFTFGEENDQFVSNANHHKIMKPANVEYYNKMKQSFTTCFEESIGFFVSCVPNITNGKLKVEVFGLRFSDVLEAKKQSKFLEAVFYVFLAVVSFVIGGWIFYECNK